MRIEKMLKIGEVSILLQIPSYVLRYWETEFKDLKPHKSRSGQRLYSEKDIEVLRRIAHLRYDEKLTVSGCKNRMRDRNTGDKEPLKVYKHSEIFLSELAKIKKGLQDVLEDLR
ncbi:MerR family transcriptional regulator [bacterium]|nr:MerR family transcriptional regulator [bacterium]